MSSAKKLVSVFNGTGQQGSAVVRALLKDGGYNVRSFTRNPESNASKQLASMGVQVIKCDESKPKEDIVQALENSFGVYLVTNTSAYPNLEEEYGIKVADAALEAKVQHIVFSTLPDPIKISNGKFTDLIDYNNKVNIEKHIRALSKENPSFTSSFVSAPMYFQNFKTYFPLQKHDNGDGSVYYSLDLPGTPDLALDHGDIEDIGPLAVEQFNNPTKYDIIPLSSQLLTGPQIAETFTKVLGKKVVYNYIPSSEYAKSNVYVEPPLIAHLYDYYNEFGYFLPPFDISIAPKICKLTTFEEYLKKSNFQLD